MILQEVLRRIKFKVGTTDDISGRAINPIVNNRNIIDELNSQIRQYANITKGIQDIYSFPLERNQIYVDAPSLALRSQTYFYLYVIVGGVIFPMDMRGPKDVYRNFQTNPVSGIPNWFMPFHEGASAFFGVFPKDSSAPIETTLSADIDKDDTTIPVVSTASYIANNGRLTIDNEVVKFQYKDDTNFYGCERGLEESIAAYHTSATTVTENNVVIHYSRLHTPILVYDDDLIPQEVLERNVEVVDEHMEGIIKAVAYNLLIKIDNERSIPYKLDYTTLYEQYKSDIEKGYYSGRSGAGVRQPTRINERSNVWGWQPKY